MPVDDIGTIERPVVKDEKKLDKPKMWQVVLFNDDFTPMELVVDVLMKYFNKGIDEAFALMISVHNHGRGICGVYPKDVAETKVDEAIKHAKAHDFALRLEVQAQP